MRKENLESIEIRHSSDTGQAKKLAKKYALEIGFEENMIEEIGLVIDELATNLAIHGGGGNIDLSSICEGERKGIQIDSIDSGPGITDVEHAVIDGYSTVGSLGYGLGTVNRLMDEFEIASNSKSGAHVICRRWIRVKDPYTAQCPLAVGAATRPHPKMQGVNGDAFIIKEWNGTLLVSLIDGLGHGQWAYRAAQTARLYVESHFDQPLDDIFRGVGRTCRSTRGVVMALARFDWTREKLTFANIGNIEARTFNSNDSVKFYIRRGIIGFNAPKPVVTEHDWNSENIIVINTDGIRGHWQWKDFPGMEQDPAPVIAQRLLRALARDEDDATVIVVKGKASCGA